MTRRNRRHQSMQRVRQTSKRVGLILGGFFAVVLTVSFLFDDMGIRKYLAMLRYARELEQDIQELESLNADLRIDIRRIQHDPVRLEELARERLGFVRKGETVYQAVPETTGRGKER